MNEKILPIVSGIGQLIAAKGHVPHSQVDGIVRQVDTLKAIHGNAGLGIKLLCQPPGNAVQFHAHQSCALHGLRQQAKEVAYAHSRFQNGIWMNAYLLQCLIHSLNHGGAGKMRVQGRTTGRSVFLRGQQRF